MRATSDVGVYLWLGTMSWCRTAQSHDIAWPYHEIELHVRPTKRHRPRPRDRAYSVYTLHDVADLSLWFDRYIIPCVSSLRFLLLPHCHLCFRLSAVIPQESLFFFINPIIQYLPLITFNNNFTAKLKHGDTLYFQTILCYMRHLCANTVYP